MKMLVANCRGISSRHVRNQFFKEIKKMGADVVVLSETNYSMMMNMRSDLHGVSILTRNMSTCHVKTTIQGGQLGWQCFSGRV